ncbi:MAG: ABC transporter ATP-binding protein [Acidiphilium sp. 34-60-192]|nr:MAG: ABC transporter ATP-binding protein [Acidiphilium sp. 34-60-192]
MPIVIDHVSKDFGAFHALDDVSLTIEDGTFVTILGSSGCGKSTLLNMIAGLSSPTRGRLMRLYPWLSLRDNIAFGLRMQSAARGIDWRRVDELIEIIGLRGFEQHRPYELSGGMQQRVAIARALVMAPRVLLMDEPFGALDAQTRHTMQQFLLDLWDRIKATVVFITHDIDEAILLADRLVVMSARPGQIALETTVPLMRPRHWDMSLEPGFLDLNQRVTTPRSTRLRAKASNA